MKIAFALALALAMLGALGGCGSKVAKQHPVAIADPVHAAMLAARIPSTPGEHAPSLVAIDRTTARSPDEVSDGTMLADVDSCASCHPDAAAQWGKSAHSFASFGNPIYRVN